MRQNDNLIGENTVIDPSVKLGSFVKIGKNNKILGATILENVVIGDDNVIEQSVIRDCVIGNRNCIGPFTNLNDHVEIKDDNIIGNFVEAKRSTFGSRNKVKHHAYLGDSLLEDDIHIGAGMITANYNFKDQQKYKTKIKSGANIGANVVLIAPVTIGKRVIIAAGSVIDRDILDDSLAIERSNLIIKPRKDR